MTESMKRFCEEASRNEELRKKLMAVEEPSVGSTVAIAKEYGFDITEDDFKGEASCLDGVISHDELDAVSGGGGKDGKDIEGNQCFCAVGGGKLGEERDTCACVVAGFNTGFSCFAAGWIHY